jgi:hypothetical protein
MSPLLQVLLDELDRLLVPDGDVVPLSALLALAVAILPGLGGRDAEVRHRTVLQVSDLGVFPEATDQFNFVQ